jgi:hypothetical protein
VLKKDTDAWLNSFPKVTGKVGDAALAAAEQRLAELGKAVAAGHLDRSFVVEQLKQITEEAGLVERTAA